MAAVHTRDIGEETLDLLRRLIALQSVNDLTPDSGQEIKAANLFEDYFAGLPVTCERIEAHPGRHGFRNGSQLRSSHPSGTHRRCPSR